MTITEFQTHAHEFVDWIVRYYQNIEQYDVKSQVVPKQILKQLPEAPPTAAESMTRIFSDFQNIIMPGINHWQSPSNHAYFPANTSYPSVLAEMLTAALGVLSMKWDMSPAASELEELVLNWLKQMTGLPAGFHGVIQDSASSATLCALLTARERHSNFDVNTHGFTHNNYRIYCSTEAHSSIEKAVKIAGFGKTNLIKIPVQPDLSIDVSKLEQAINQDITNGLKPLCVVAALGTTGTVAIDPIKEIGKLCAKYNIWFHVDAAYLGNALILPEYQHLIEGIELVDSLVFNPHKWLFTNFDCSAYFVKSKEALVRTFEILPEYLKTKHHEDVNNYCDQGVQLGRRFRALKLWFVIRSFGVSGLQSKLRDQIEYARVFAELVEQNPQFEFTAPVSFNVVCFRYKPSDTCTEQQLTDLNATLLDKLNQSGKLYMSHTKVHGKYTLRFVCGQTYIEKRHVVAAWNTILENAQNILPLIHEL